MSEEAQQSATTETHVPLSTTVAYGFGSVAYGVKDNGFGTFLLIFYSQVLGLAPALVGLALMIALVFDAVSDPILGQISDKTRSKYGRRHPFMYAAIVPIAIAYYFLWNPPAGIVENHAFAYLLVMAILVRLCVTFFEVPSSALIGEITTDYDDRTRLLSFRYFFGWMGGTGIAFVAWTFLLVPTEQYEHGVLNREAYGTYGLLAVCIMVIAISLSALGTQKRAQSFKYQPKKEPLDFKKNFQEVWHTMLSPNFKVLFIAGIPGAIAVGITGSLATYFNTYFWGFNNVQIGLMVWSAITAAFIAPLITPSIAKYWGKKPAAVMTSVIALGLAPIPILLRLIGFFPEMARQVFSHRFLFSISSISPWRL